MVEKSADKRIVVTGIGAITPVGLTAEESFKALIEGKSGIALIEPKDDYKDSKVRIAGQVKGFDSNGYFSDKESRRTPRCAQFATAASIKALTDAGLYADGKLQHIDPIRIGLIMGTAIGGSSYFTKVEDVIRDKGEDRIYPLSTLLFLLGRTASVPSIKIGIKGPVDVVDAECASGSRAISNAIRIIRSGDADVVVAGGAEAPIEKSVIVSFAKGKALSTRNDSPTEASRPFDQDADGFVVAEGVGVLVLESLEYAMKRNANIYAEVLGYGDTSDAFHHTDPSGEGAIRAMLLALKRAGIRPGDVDYINTHGPSTEAGDGVELDAIREVFGEDATSVLVSSTKSAIGHTLGAAGGIEAVICVLAIRDNIVPPTLNLKTPINEAEGLDLVPLEARRDRQIVVALSNSFGLGGLNSVLVFKRYK